TSPAGVISSTPLRAGFTDNTNLNELQTGTAAAPTTGVGRSSADEDVLLVGGTQGVYRLFNPLGDPSVPGGNHATIPLDPPGPGPPAQGRAAAGRRCVALGRPLVLLGLHGLECPG